MPGLLGALLVSLLVISLFQLPVLTGLRATPAPLLLALALLVLPFAVVLRALLDGLRPGGAIHLASLLRDSPHRAPRRMAWRLLWDLRTRRSFWVAFLLFLWAYFDLTAGAILHPPRMTPVFVRLYNLMHYGQTQVRSAMATLAFLVPFALMGIAWALRAQLGRLETHE
jgi:ABC-type Fe3+ transport system permease subunit